jgi:hypothetical protein
MFTLAHIQKNLSFVWYTATPVCVSVQSSFRTFPTRLKLCLILKMPKYLQPHPLHAVCIGERAYMREPISHSFLNEASRLDIVPRVESSMRHGCWFGILVNT